MQYLANQNAIGSTEWLPLDYRQRPPTVTINVLVPSTVSAVTYSVDYTNDDLMGNTKVFPSSISRTTTTATVVSPLHGLNVGDSLRVLGTGFPNNQATTLDGLFTVASVTDANTFTYTVTNSGVTAASSQTYYIPMRVTTLSSFSGKTASFDGNVAFPVRAVRLRVTAYTGTGNVLMEVTQGPSSA